MGGIKARSAPQSKDFLSARQPSPARGTFRSHPLSPAIRPCQVADQTGLDRHLGGEIMSNRTLFWPPMVEKTLEKACLSSPGAGTLEYPFFEAAILPRMAARAVFGLGRPIFCRAGWFCRPAKWFCPFAKSFCAVAGSFCRATKSFFSFAKPFCAVAGSSCASTKSFCRATKPFCAAAKPFCTSAGSFCAVAKRFCRPSKRFCRSSKPFCRTAKPVCFGVRSPRRAASPSQRQVSGRFRTDPGRRGIAGTSD